MPDIGVKAERECGLTRDARDTGADLPVRSRIARFSLGHTRDSPGTPR